MAETGGMSFREIQENQGFPQRWKEINVTTGGQPGSLQDLKLPESAGGYAYRDIGKVSEATAAIRNRFIYWRCHKEVLELIEESLDFCLSSNTVRFRFQDAPILPSVVVQETHSHVVVLVSTVSSAHRLLFQHPNKLHKAGAVYHQGTDRSVTSIFHDVSVASTQDPSSMYSFRSGTGPAYQFHAASAWLTNEGEALFAMATNTGSIVLLKMPSFGLQGVPIVQELKQSSMMQRLWTGLVPSLIRGGHSSADTAFSLVMHPVGNDVFIFAVCQDHKLRMWSCKDYSCLMVADLTEFMPEARDIHKLTLGGEGHQIRKFGSRHGQGHILKLAVFLCFSDRCQFCIFNPVLADGRYQLNFVTSIFGPNEDLVDFCLSSSHLWSLWTNSEGEAVARCAPINSGTGSSANWIPVIMEAGEPPELAVQDIREPRETYMEHIFQPGHFSMQAILKALKIFRRSLDSSFAMDSNIPIEVMKMQVSAAVEHEINAASSDYDLSEEDYYQLQLQHWGRFYSCCVQYQQVGNKPVGLFADNSTGLVALLKKNTASFVRTCHILEHLYLSALGSISVEDIEGMAFISEDDTTCHDVINLCECLKLLTSCLSGEMAYAFEQDLYHTQSPHFVAQQVVKALLTGSGDQDMGQTVQDLLLSVKRVRDIPKSVGVVLQLLDLSQGQPEGLLTDDLEVEASRMLSCGHLFSSNLAVALLARSVAQLAETRFEVARDLLVLLTLMTHTGEQVNVGGGVGEQVRGPLTAHASQLVQAYFLLHWCTKMQASQTSASTLDSSVQQIEALGLQESAVPDATHRLVSQRLSLAELFLYGPGGTQTRTMLAQTALLDEDPCPLWSAGFLPAATTLAQLLWPLGMNFIFPEYLMYQCQYSQLEDYVRLAQSWCDWNSASRKFMLGLGYINTNEPYKAVDAFQEAVHGVTSEDFLTKLTKPDSEVLQHVEVAFYLKVIQLFEQFSLPHLVVTLATTAIGIADENDPNVPTLWSKVFKHELELGHNDQAYAAMIANPDPSRRKDCLRQFIVVLCERGQLQDIVQFPYVDLHDEVVGIIESRARSVDLTTHNYYDLLYSFHIFKNNYRKAGSVMYEFGLRLGREVHGIKGLQRQAKCYLAAMNALRLVDPNYAWIVKPSSSSDSGSDDEEMGQSPKHFLDGEDKDFDMRKRLEVLTLDELEKEYMLVHARLRLLQHDQEAAHMSGPTPSADETISLLVNGGLFDSAINICRMFNMSLTPVFEGLASRCVSLARHSGEFMQGDNDYTAQAWQWLDENEMGASHPARGASSADQAWRLLQTYLERYEDVGTRYHKCVALRLLSHAFPLPNWFIASYKRMNAAGLLRLYLDYDYLDEAAYLTLEYIDAVLGKGTEYFGLKSYLKFGSPAVWLPYTCIDQLLLALKDASTVESSYRQVYEQLSLRLNEYHRTLESVSADTVQMAASGPRRGRQPTAMDL